MYSAKVTTLLTGVDDGIPGDFTHFHRGPRGGVSRMVGDICWYVLENQRCIFYAVATFYVGLTYVAEKFQVSNLSIYFKFYLDVSRTGYKAIRSMVIWGYDGI